MGLFSRNQSPQDDTDDIVEQVDLPNRSDINEDYFSEPEVQGQVAVKPIQPPPSQLPSYTIEDAIKLMRSLPQDNQEMVVTVVKKTLESTRINIRDILADADIKENQIKQQQEKLEREIKQLKAKIAERNQRIETLKEDMITTVSVRESLQLALDLESKTGTKSSSTASKPGKGKGTASPANTTLEQRLQAQAQAQKAAGKASKSGSTESAKKPGAAR